MHDDEEEEGEMAEEEEEQQQQQQAEEKEEELEERASPDPSRSPAAHAAARPDFIRLCYILPIHTSAPPAPPAPDHPTPVARIAPGPHHPPHPTPICALLLLSLIRQLPAPAP